MVVDHVNYVFFGHVANVMWYLGRPVFPLFAFAMVCNLIRGTDLPNYMARLIVVGVIAQPIYATLMATDMGDTLLTLAIGAALVALLRVQRPLVQHLVFLVAIATIFSTPLPVRSGLDYGLAGMLFPAALYLVLTGMLSHTLWLALLLFALNWYPISDPWQLAPVQVALWIAASAILIVLASLCLRGRPRFLPRYMLYIFYPGHLIVLLAIRHWI